MALEFRTVAADEMGDLVRTTEAAFGASGDGPVARVWADALEPDRSWAAFDGGRLVGASSTLTMQLTVPGGASVPIGGLTAVGVLPTHRRRGILRELMARHIDDVVARSEVAGALTASESRIYGRFGYGIATWRAGFEIETPRASFRGAYKDPGSSDLVDRAGALETFPDLHERIRVAVAGGVSVSRPQWEAFLVDLEEEADEGVFHVVHRDADGVPDGYAIYFYEYGNWAGSLSTTRAKVRLGAVDAGARLALWRFLFDLDLVERVSTTWAPVDDPVRWVLDDPRRLRTTQVVDDLWLRILDVPVALRARTYSMEGQLVLDVHDELRPETGGRFLLEASRDGATCVRTDEAADASLDIAALSSLWLGGHSFRRLREAGRIHGTDEAIEAADRLFGIPVAPFSGVGF